MTNQGFWSKVHPNHVTMSRILMCAMLLALIYLGGPIYLGLALPLYTIIAVSDKIDGYLARKYDKITETGKMLDRIADKFFIGSNLIVYSYLLIEIFPGWPIYVGCSAFMIIIELWLFYTALGKFFNWEKFKGLEAAANVYGKAKMGLEIGVTAASLLGLFLLELKFSITNLIGQILFILATITFIPTIYYGIKSARGHMTIKVQ